MSQPDIGVDIDDLRLELRAGLRRAADLGFRTIELSTVAGDLEPSNLSSSGRRYLSRRVSGLGLRMAALVADMPGLRLTDARTADQCLERTCRILQLARDLKVRVVTASSGRLADAETGDPLPSAVEALKQLGEYADSRGVVYALRPSCASGGQLARVMDEVRCPSIQICLDPGAMVMDGANPLSVIERFPEQIALMHARDGTAGLSGRTGHETRLGEGEVDLIGVFAMLEDVGYAGPYVLRRTDSQNPIADIERARTELLRVLPQR